MATLEPNALAAQERPAAARAETIRRVLTRIDTVPVETRDDEEAKM